MVDGRAGEDWLVYRPAAAAAADSQQQQQADSSERLTHLYDAAGSWWTQTAATPQLQLELSRAVAGAAGRYMHVMWPQVRRAGDASQHAAASDWQHAGTATALVAPVPE